MKQNLILDFNHIYDRHNPHVQDFIYLDCSHFTECDMYCSLNSQKALTRMLSPFTIHGTHLLDNGNYHYLSYFFVKQIKEPFNLLVFDHHTDMQDPLFSDLLTCGNWIKKVIETQPYLHQLILIGPKQKAFHNIAKYPKLIAISDEDLSQKDLHVLETIEAMPTYISIDKDVLSSHYALTNWNQGVMSLPTLEKLLSIAIVKQPIIGIDLCGEADVSMPFPELVKAEHLNEKTDVTLLQFIKLWMAFKKVEKIK